MLIAPSLLAADFLHLGSEMQMLNASADWIHLDVMDGTLVPNISFGFSVIDALMGVAQKPMDAHLMVVHPERWFERLAADSVSCVSFHLEAACRHTGPYLERIRSLGMKAGVAINPDIPVQKLYPYIGKADFFLIMSVFAGFGGQKFIPGALSKLTRLSKMLDGCNHAVTVEVDGGVKLDNCAEIARAGAEVLVAGSAIFNASDPAQAVQDMKTYCRV